MPKHHCFAFNCTNSEAKEKDPVKYSEVASVTFHCFPSNDEKKQYSPGMSEQERRRRWIVACRLESLNVTRHTRIHSKHFEGGLRPTKANPVPTIFDFPKHLQRSETMPGSGGKTIEEYFDNKQNLEGRQTWPIEGQAEHNESVIGEKICSEDLLIATPEVHYNEIGDQLLLLEKPQPAELHVHPKKIKDSLVYRDEAVLTDSRTNHQNGTGGL